MDDREDPDARKVSHILLWIIVIIIGGWLVWSATHSVTKNSTSTFASGSHQSNVYHVNRNYALASLSLMFSPFTWNGCELKKDKPISEPEQVTNEVEEDSNINAVINTEKPNGD